MSGGTGIVTGHLPPNGPELGSGAGTAFHHGTELPLGCLPTSPGCARAHTDAVLREWGLAELADDAVLLVSEMTTNACDASVIWPDKPPIVLRLSADESRVLIEVWDHSPDDPAPIDAGVDEEMGRGLKIIEALATRWGVDRHGPRLKAVWAEMEVAGQVRDHDGLCVPRHVPAVRLPGGLSWGRWPRLCHRLPGLAADEGGSAH